MCIRDRIYVIEAQQEFFFPADLGDYVRNFLFCQVCTLLQLLKVIVHFPDSSTAVPVDDKISVYVDDPSIASPIKAVDLQPLRHQADF